MPGAPPGPEPRAVHWRLAVLAALPWEVRPFLRRHRCRRRADLGRHVWDFAAGQGRGVLALSGQGADAARRALARLLAHGRPQVLVSLGFGGALTPGLAPGAVVLGESFWRFDPESAILQGVAAPPPPHPLPELLQRLKEAGLSAATGSVVSTTHIIHKERLEKPLKGLLNPVLDLETTALAEAAAALLKGLPFLSLRAITDAAGEEIPQFLRRGWGPTLRPRARTTLSWLATDPRRLRHLIHLYRRSRHAAQHLSQALTVLLPLLVGEEVF